jgi:diguanylate cyclase (GGDEF)-like protein
VRYRPSDQEVIATHRVFGRAFFGGAVFMVMSMAFPGQARPDGDLLIGFLGLGSFALAWFESRAKPTWLRRSESMMATITPWMVALTIYASTIDAAAVWSLPILLLPSVVSAGYFQARRIIWMSMNATGAGAVLLLLSNTPEIRASQDDIEAMITFVFSVMVASMGAWRIAEGRRKLAFDLEQLASTDSLTGILNRRAFLTAATDLLETSQTPLVVMLADVDHFKRVNDRFGHDVGDDVLRQVAVSMSKLFGDDQGICGLVGRMGGEEFAMVARAPLEVAIAGARLLGTELGQARPTAMSISIGVAVSTPECTIADLLRGADVRLYAAKEHGRSRLVFGDELSQHVVLGNGSTTTDSSVRDGQAPNQSSPFALESLLR